MAYVMSVEQFAAWKQIADEDVEFADEVLRYLDEPKSEAEAFENLLSDEDYTDELGLKYNPKFGTALDVAKRIAEMV